MRSGLLSIRPLTHTCVIAILVAASAIWTTPARAWPWDPNVTLAGVVTCVPPRHPVSVDFQTSEE
jgi:hypothetical protein